MLLLLLAGCGTRKSDSAAPAIRFTEAAAETGLRFEHRNGATGELYMPEIMGAGVAVFDMDLDGDLDVYLVQSEGAGVLYRNDFVPSGKLTFVDVTAGSGIAYAGYGMGAATGDIDNDGDPDLLVTGHGSRALYRNIGTGKFAEVPLPQPPVTNLWGSSASFFDYDRDGDLDLVILSYVNFTKQNHKKCQAPTGEPDYCTPKAYSPMAARLYRNEDGKGRFTDVTAKSGIDRALGPGLGVAALDLNGDRWPDLFVANDTAANHVWINQKDGTFRESGLEVGAAFSEDGLAKAGMGVAAGDMDRDGDEDFFVLNLMREGATLFRNDGVGPNSGLPNFFDISRVSGVYSQTFDFTGFGTGWLDADRDGSLDLFIANGAVTLREDQRGKPRPFSERKLLLRGNGAGKFQDVSLTSGATFAEPEISRGAAFGDLDNDGDIDIVVTNNGGPVRLLRNDSPATGNHWFAARLNAPVATGARVTLSMTGGKKISRRSYTDSSYCSASDPRVYFGLGSAVTTIERVEVEWPDGQKQSWPNPRMDSIVELRRSN